MKNIKDLNGLGQSVWLNYLRRAFVESGEFNEYLAAGVAGVTSTPTIFEKAIIGSADYDQALTQSVKAGLSVKTVYDALVVDDCQRAADLLHPLFERTQGLDGYVSVELDPDLAHDEVGTVAAGRHLMATVNRANAMLEIPATPAGLAAMTTLIGEGISVNVTHVFSIATYEKAARAFLAGIEKYLDAHSGWPFRPASVASFSISAVDSAVDTILAAIGRPDWQGKTAIAMAKVIYGRFRDLFSGPDWEAMAHRRARPQRPKWTRTTPRNFSYPDTLYVDALIGRDTVTTVSPAVFHAFVDHGTAANTLSEGLAEAQAYLDALAELGIDLEQVAGRLQEESLAHFHTYYQALLGSAARKREQLDTGWQRMEMSLGSWRPEVQRALAEVAEKRLVARIWARDHTIRPAATRNRLGWLQAVEVMQESAGRIQAFAASVLADRYTRLVLLDATGDSLVPQLFYQTFGKPGRPSYSPYPYLELAIVDLNDQAAVATQGGRPDLNQTLFMATGQTNESLARFNAVYNLMAENLPAGRAGEHFIAIAEPDSPLVEMARGRHFRELFLNEPYLGGPYAALSFLGLVPAALFGVNLAVLLDRARTMVINAASCNRPVQGDNLAARLGATLAALGQSGRPKLTLITSPAVSSFGEWIKQLVAERAADRLTLVISDGTTKLGRYDPNSVFIYLRLRGDDQHDEVVRELQEAGRPVVTLHLEDLYDLGGQFFLWEMALAVATAG